MCILGENMVLSSSSLEKNFLPFTYFIHHKKFILLKFYIERNNKVLKANPNMVSGK